MKLKVKDIYEIVEGLNGILDKELPTSVAFLIQRNYKIIGEEVETANEIRQKIADKYKEYADKDGLIKDEKMAKKYKEEMDELMSQEVDIIVNEIELKDLGNSIKPRTLGLLEKIIKSEDD